MNIEALVKKLQEQEAAVDVARTTLSATTARAQTDFYHTQQQLGLCISGLASAPRELEAEQALLAELEAQRAIVLTKHAELEKQLVDAPDWRLAGDGHVCDREYERQRTLTLQLERLRAGTLLFAPNQAYTRVEDIDARLKESNERIERLRAQIAAHLQAAGQLLGETVTP